MKPAVEIRKIVEPAIYFPEQLDMGHELAVEVVETPAGSGLTCGEICVVNPYLACGRCIACARGKPNCCVSVSVLGVHQDGGMTELLSVPPANLIAAPGLTVDECAAVEFLAIGAHDRVSRIDRKRLTASRTLDLTVPRGMPSSCAICD